MGYCIQQVDSSFKILRANQEAAFKAAKAMPDRDYHWVKRGWTKGLRDIFAMLEHWGYEPQLDDDTGDITDVAFQHEKLGDELELFKAIAPFVEAGSFLEMSGEDGGRWRWVFDGKTCKEVYAKMTWE